MFKVNFDFMCKHFKGERGKKLLQLVILPIVCAGALLIFSDNLPHLFTYSSSISDYFRIKRANRVASQKDEKPEVVLIVVNEKFLNQLPYRSPLDRCVLAHVLESILKINPKVIGIDYLFDDKTEPKKDNQLRGVFKKYKDRIVLAKSPTDYVNKDLPMADATEAFFGSGDMFASAVLIKDHDNVVRRASLTDAQVETFALKLVKRFGRSNTNFKLEETFQIDWLSVQNGQGDVFLTLPIEFFVNKSINRFCDVQITSSNVKVAYIKNLVENKIVIISADLDREDKHLSPFDILEDGQPLLSGAEIHAQIIQQVLDSREIRNIPFVFAVLMIWFAYLFSHWVEHGAVFEKFKEKSSSPFMKIFLLTAATFFIYFIALTIEFIFIYFWELITPTGLIFLALGAPFLPYIKQIILNKG